MKYHQVNVGWFWNGIWSFSKYRTKQRWFPTRLQDCDLFQDNKDNDDGDFVHFALMDKYEPVRKRGFERFKMYLCYEGGAGIDWEEQDLRASWFSSREKAYRCEIGVQGQRKYQRKGCEEKR